MPNPKPSKELAAGAEAVGEYLPPHNIHAEQSVIGAMLIQPRCIPDIQPILEPEDFYRDNHQTLYKAILSLHRRKQAIDVLTIENALSKAKLLDAVGGMPYVTSILASVPSAGNVEYYARIVAENSTLRSLLDAAYTVIGIVRDPEIQDAGEALDAARSVVNGVQARGLPGQSLAVMGQVIAEQFEEDAERADSGETGKPRGYTTGFGVLDRMTGGIKKSQLIVIGAKPGLGKTTLALNIAQHFVDAHGLTPLIVSLESDKKQLARRIICAEARIDSMRVEANLLTPEEWERYLAGRNKLERLPILVDETLNSDMAVIERNVTRGVREGRYDAVFVDYLQIVRAKGFNNDKFAILSDVIRRFNLLALTLDIPVVVLSQLSRESDSGAEARRPRISDLRGSGEIEENAYQVWLLHNEDFERSRKAGAAARGEVETCEVIVAKNKNGQVGSVNLGFYPTFTKFVPLDQVHGGEY